MLSDLDAAGWSFNHLLGPLKPKFDIPQFVTNANPLQLYHSLRAEILAFKHTIIYNTMANFSCNVDGRNALLCCTRFFVVKGVLGEYYNEYLIIQRINMQYKYIESTWNKER